MLLQRLYDDMFELHSQAPSLPRSKEQTDADAGRRSGLIEPLGVLLPLPIHTLVYDNSELLCGIIVKAMAGV
jgi:hypothetical protein